jgi:hypothetical protein
VAGWAVRILGPIVFFVLLFVPSMLGFEAGWITGVWMVVLFIAALFLYGR